MKMIPVVIGLLVCVASSGGTQEPICIVDGARVAPTVCRGFQRPGGIEAARIESMEILRGAAAVAAYGQDAAAEGVIKITTKNGSGVVATMGDDPFARHFFPPELVMAHQQAIGLADRQRSTIQEAMKEAQGKFVDLQFRMSAEAETLQRLIQGRLVDEAKVLEQVDRVLALERQIKHTQLTLMIRIKNQLTAEQQAALMRLRP